MYAETISQNVGFMKQNLGGGFHLFLNVLASVIRIFPKRDEEPAIKWTCRKAKWQLGPRQTLQTIFENSRYLVGAPKHGKTATLL